ncbi:MAG: molybdopterin-dependent oxidoreductase [Pyrinomonadaceae bacterium]
MPEQVKLTINGQDFEVDKGARLIDVCREKGFGIPSFCYYKDLALQASCRMCLVRIDKMPKLQTSCTITVTDGMVVTTGSEEVEKAQRAMGEFLLANHPLDCPVCDRGGECELQEVIFDWGDVEERFSERKNVQPEKYLSPIVANDPQRCILCKRCTRVCDEWMGEDAIEAGNRGVNTVIGTYGGWLNCSQCGNCIEVCPTGTLLDGLYRHETRPWELDNTISTDCYSSDGMQIAIGSRMGRVHRIVARDRYVNGLNGEFLDVKARFGHGFVDHPDRIKTPLIRYTKGGKLIPATWDQAVQFAGERLAAAGEKLGIIASPRLTNESIFTLRRLAEAVGGGYAIAENADVSAVFRNLTVPLATHNDIRYAKTIVQIGGEPEEEQTFTAKQVRQAVRNSGARFIVINEIRTNLARQSATDFIHLNEGSLDAFALGFADGFSDIVLEKIGQKSDVTDAFAKAIGETQGDLVLMIGNDLSPEAQALIANAAAGLASDGRRVLLHPLARHNNSVGAIDMMPDAQDLGSVIKQSNALMIGGSLQHASVLKGNDLVVVQELFLTETTDHADVVLPASSFAEVDGTYTNNAGNVQRVRAAIDPLHQSKPDWMITTLLARALGHKEVGVEFSGSGIFKSIADAVPAYAGLRYPNLRDESNPVQVKHEIRPESALSTEKALIEKRLESMPANGTKNTEKPRIGHRLHRLTTLTSKTPQFHLLANGNPKPENLLVSPLVQFDQDGKPRQEELAEAAVVGVGDRSNPGGR